MKKYVLGMALATFAGAAAAGDLSEPRYHESDDYSAKVYYRVDFGGQARNTQSVGLRFDSVRAEAAGAPSMFHASFSGQGVEKLAVSGLDLRAMMLAAKQNEGGAFWTSFTTVDWVALGVVSVGFLAVAVDNAEGEDTGVPGTGGS